MPTPEPGAGEQPTAQGRSDNGSPAERLWWFRDARQPSPTRTSYRLRWLRRGHTLDALACLSVSTLCFSQARSETLFLADWGFYNRVPLGAPALVALLLNIVALAAVGFLGVQAIRRVERPAWRRLAAARPRRRSCSP